jgi:S-adenosylmethionine/arginine decarboxylase-like enzyme
VLEDGVLPIGVSHLLLHKWPEPDDADADIPPAGLGGRRQIWRR